MSVQSTFFWFMASSALALAFAVFAVWSMRRRTAGLLGTALRFGACLLICAALIQPAALRPGGRPTVAALLDASNSVAPPQELNERQRRAIEQLANDERVGFVAFAGTCRRLLPGRDAFNTAIDEAAGGETADSAKRLNPAATDIEGALAYAADLLRAPAVGRTAQAARRRIILLSDGAETYGDARAMIPRLQAEGIAVFAVPLDHAPPPPLQIRELRLPPSAPVGVVGARLLVESGAAAEAELEAYLDGKLAFSSRRGGSVQLEKGVSSVPFSFRADSSGEKRLSVSLRLPNGVEARSAAYIQIAGRLKGLYVHGGGERTAAWAALAGDPSLEWVEAEAEALESSGLRLQAYDVAVFDNVSAKAFSFEWMESFRAWVENGGGWLAIGGPDSFGAGQWTQTGLEKAAPVLTTPPDKRKPLALVLLLDKSGSAARRAKWTLAVRAAEAAARALHPKDYVAVVAFDAKPQTSVPLIEAGKRGKRIEQLAELSPGGGTDLAAGLEAAYELLRHADAPRKHAVVFSDGHSLTDPANAARRMFADGITVSAAAVGVDARADLAEAARLGGGAFYALKDASDLPEVFIREAAAPGELIVQQRTRLIPAAATALVDGLNLTAEGYVSAAAKPGANVFLKTEEGDPLLVGWRYGLGRALAFLSDGGNRWTTEWAASEGYAARWRSWTAWTAPSTDAAGYDLSAAAVDSTLTVRAEFPEESQTPARFFAEAMDPKGGRFTIRMKRQGNGFVGRLPLGPSGAYAVSAGPEGDSAEALIRRRVHYDGNAETSAPPDPNLLNALAEATGGAVAAELGDWILPPAREPRPLSPWLLGGALTLMAVEWILRQIRFPSRKGSSAPSAPSAPFFPARLDEEAPLLVRMRQAKTSIRKKARA